jgi:hypothetical protein
MPKDWERAEELIREPELPSRNRAITMLWEILAVVVLAGGVWLILQWVN